jgi:hypothetical protein
MFAMVHCKAARRARCKNHNESLRIKGANSDLVSCFGILIFAHTLSFGYYSQRASAHIDSEYRAAVLLTCEDRGPWGSHG